MAFVSIGSPLLWLGFAALVLACLALDLGVFHRRAHIVRWREALAWTGVWITLALLFNAFLWWRFGTEVALQFATGYLVEKALSIDNLFVFVMIFSLFCVPEEAQYRILYWGVLGALVMRAAFILAGTSLLQRFHWMMYVFGTVLLIGAIRLMRVRQDDVHPDRNLVVRLAGRLLPRRVLTPFIIVLIAIETTDLVFAIDSIPAVFAVTSDPFIVYTSNVFAILGLRALYFVLAGVLVHFHYLRPALAVILAFVAAKMLLFDVVEIPIQLSLLVIAFVLAIAVAASVLRRPVIAVTRCHVRGRRGSFIPGR